MGEDETHRFKGIQHQIQGLTKSGAVLTKLMFGGNNKNNGKKSDIANYYAERGKLVDVDVTLVLGWVSMRGHLDIVKALLAAGADKNKVCIVYRSPLHNAIANDHEEVAKVLISAGADMSRCKEPSGAR